MALMLFVAIRLGVVKSIDQFIDLTKLLQVQMGCQVRSGQIDSLIEGQCLGILVEQFLPDDDVVGALDDIVNQVIFRGGAIEVASLHLHL